MNWNIVLSVIITLSVFAGNVFSADWKYFGSNRDSEGKSYSFYDAESIKLANNNVKVWTKQILDKYVEELAKDNVLIAEAKNKVLKGYVAPYDKIKHSNDKSYLVVTTFLEAVAAHQSTNNSIIKRLTEIDCTENKIRNISKIIMYSVESNIDPTYDSKVSEWKYTPPDSNGEMLVKILCGLK